ncbi:hypothetical protein ACFS7Z_19610 [Pontibacter toksunensis]|uniref:Integron Cassette Protein Hfx-Cass5 domain-containing protein n=1 Tax=Pontibacter toksunensis TaxID=1332631 RepID=A0ABW6C072_9BACT
MDTQVVKDKIIKIEIDDAGKLHIKPKRTKLPLIYRTATEVHWDSERETLYSPKPRVWSYWKWYKHIVNVAKEDCYCELVLSEETEWVNIPVGLKNRITQALYTTS